MNTRLQQQLEDDLVTIGLVSVFLTGLVTLGVLYGRKWLALKAARLRHAPPPLAAYSYTDEGLDRLIADLDRLAPPSYEERLADYLLEEAEPGGSQEFWNLGERQAFFLIHYLWPKTLQPKKRVNTVPQDVMDALFAPTVAPYEREHETPDQDTGSNGRENTQTER